MYQRRQGRYVALDALQIVIGLTDILIFIQRRINNAL